MTRRERRTYFDRLCALREAYGQRDAGDQPTSTTLAHAMAAAQQELERIDEETAALQAQGDPTGTHHTV